MQKLTRVTFQGTATVLEGRAVLPRLLFLLLGIVLFRSVRASDAFEAGIDPVPLSVQWLVVPRSSVETLSLVTEEAETDGDS